MATQLFKDTMISLAKDYRDFRKEILNTQDNGEGKNIECNFKDYVDFYLRYEEPFELPDEEEEDYDITTEEEDSAE